MEKLNKNVMIMSPHIGYLSRKKKNYKKEQNGNSRVKKYGNQY